MRSKFRKPASTTPQNGSAPSVIPPEAAKSPPESTKPHYTAILRTMPSTVLHPDLSSLVPTFVIQRPVGDLPLALVSPAMLVALYPEHKPPYGSTWAKIKVRRIPAPKLRVEEEKRSVEANVKKDAVTMQQSTGVAASMQKKKEGEGWEEEAWIGCLPPVHPKSPIPIDVISQRSNNEDEGSTSLDIRVPGESIVFLDGSHGWGKVKYVSSALPRSCFAVLRSLFPG